MYDDNIHKHVDAVIAKNSNLSMQTPHVQGKKHICKHLSRKAYYIISSFLLGFTVMTVLLLPVFAVDRTALNIIMDSFSSNEPALKPLGETPLQIYEDVFNSEHHFTTLSGNRVEIKNNLSIPFFNLNKWDGEATLNMNLIPVGAELTECELEMESNKLKWKVKWEINGEESEYEIEIEPTNQGEYGGLEFWLNLMNNKINTFSFPVESANLSFYYQPALNEELNLSEYDFVNETHAVLDGSVVMHRPENIVGSYAVYHSSKTNNKYKAGKAFHIYRPKIIDSNGWEIWGELDISDGYMTITIPQEFLDGAVYPVNVDPTFGETEIGTTSLYQTNSMMGSWFNCPESGTAN